MTEANTVKEFDLVKPEETDAAFVSRIAFEAPLKEASARFRMRLISLMQTFPPTSLPTPETPSQPPRTYVCEQIEAAYQSLVDTVEFYCRTVRRYRQGQAPYFIIVQDKRLAIIFVKRLGQFLENHETKRLTESRINEFYNSVLAYNGKLVQADYLEKVNKFALQFPPLIGNISDQIRKEEKARSAQSERAATPTEVKKIIAKASQKAISSIRKSLHCDYEFGIKSPSRQRQISKVIKKLQEFAEDKRKLPLTLQDKSPDKWLHFACGQVFEACTDGYPSLSALYSYCRSHSEAILGKAAL